MMSANPRDHELFQRYALSSEKQLSCGIVPIPYHIYDGYGLLIGGTANLSAVKNLLQGEQVMPVETADHQALMAVWVCDFTDASLGPHQELQFSIFVSRRTVNDIEPHPLAVIKVMLHADVRMMCHGLWNNAPRVVAYNRELLGLNANLAKGTIQPDPHNGALTFSFSTDDSNELIFKGRLRQMQRPSYRADFEMMRLLGLKTIQRLAVQPWIAIQVMNPVGKAIPHNAEAQAYTKNESNALRYFDPASDALEFGNDAYRALQFQPRFVQQMSGFKFVYLNPHNVGDATLAAVPSTALPAIAAEQRA
jgi:hypothetical protein